MAKRVGVIGSGVVGRVLADGFLEHGYEVMCGTREPEKLADWRRAGGAKASVGSVAHAARFGDLVVLAVKGAAAEKAVADCGPENLAGKTVIDATNPIADAPPDHGVLRFFTSLDESLMERLQRAAPEAHFVKCFSCVGNGQMVNPDFDGTKPTMFLCGDSDDAKREVAGVLAQFGHEPCDMGGVQAARAIEPLCILWCIPGFLRNEWTHAFKLLRR
jgi:8-hydroxy-5-deazaflavin:NADPH oxidoreductase